MAKLKISELKIKSFRGFPKEEVISFYKANDIGNPSDVIIYGGNGSGKSSIVDAIEYCLQGKIEHSEELDNRTRPSVTNFSKNQIEEPEVEISFQNGTNWHRGVIIDKKQDGEICLSQSNQDLHPNFNKAPMVLRRSDIITYNYTRGNQKLLHILQYFYEKKGKGVTENDPKMDKLLSERTKNKKKYKGFVNLLSEHTGLSVESIEINKLRALDFYRESFAPKGGNELMNNFKIGHPKIKIPYQLHQENETIGENIMTYAKKLIKIEKEIDKRRNEIDFESLDEVKELLLQCEAKMYPAFMEISRNTFVTGVRLALSEDVKTSMEIKVKLNTGIEVCAYQIFSEANFDLLILILYMSLIEAAVEKGQAPVLILDDVLQSVDSPIRNRFLTYYAKKLSKWQFIITCHDRLWLREITEIFQNVGKLNRKVLKIGRWSLNDGPDIRSVDFSVVDNSIGEALKTDNPQIIASQAGLMLEKICDKLTQTLKANIQRSEGDQYTLAPLIQSLSGRITSIKDFPVLQDCWNDIIENKYIRNIIGAHHNDYAESFDEDKIIEFAQSVQILYELTFCPKCNSWLTLNGKEISCKKKCDNRIFHLK